MNRLSGVETPDSTPLQAGLKGSVYEREDNWEGVMIYGYF
jgi:hypothetical protein